MDNTTKALRARLLAAYRRLRADIGDPGPSPTGYFGWLSSQVERDAGNQVESDAGDQTQTGWIGDQQLEVVVGDSLAGREGKAEAFARVFLGAIASDAEVGFLSRCLESRQALAKNPAGETAEHERWTISRPNGTSLSPEPMRASAMLCYVAEVLDEWIEHLNAPSPQSAAAPPNLGKKAKAVLKLLYGDKAFDEHHACKLANRAPSALPYPTAKAQTTRVKYAEQGSSELVTKGLALASPHTGTWLTPAGKAEAERLFKR